VQSGVLDYGCSACRIERLLQQFWLLSKRQSTARPIVQAGRETGTEAVSQQLPMDYRQIGQALASHINRSSGVPTGAALQGMIADLAADHTDLVAPLKDLVSRQTFRSLIPMATSGGGAIQRDALIQEISRVYHPAVLIAIEDVLNGFLEASGGVALQISQSSSAQEDSSGIQTNKDNIGAGSAPHVTVSHFKDRDAQNNRLSVSQVYFYAALELAKHQSSANIESASHNTSGKGILNYVVRDSAGKDLARVNLAMLDATLRSAKTDPRHQHGEIDHSPPSSASNTLFQRAVDLARRMGNTNLRAASAPASSKGLVNYTIRDSMSNTLAKVPLSMLKNMM